MSHEDVSARIGRNLCADDSALYFDIVLLLHEEMDAAPQNRSISLGEARRRETRNA